MQIEARGRTHAMKRESNKLWSRGLGERERAARKHRPEKFHWRQFFGEAPKEKEALPIWPFLHFFCFEEDPWKCSRTRRREWHASSLCRRHSFPFPFSPAYQYSNEAKLMLGLERRRGEETREKALNHGFPASLRSWRRGRKLSSRHIRK